MRFHWFLTYSSYENNSMHLELILIDVIAVICSQNLIEIVNINYSKNVQFYIFNLQFHIVDNVFWWPTFIREGYGKLLSMDWYVDTFFIIR